MILLARTLSQFLELLLRQEMLSVLAETGSFESTNISLDIDVDEISFELDKLAMND